MSPVGGNREGNSLQGGKFEIRLCRKEAEFQWSLTPYPPPREETLLS